MEWGLIFFFLISSGCENPFKLREAEPPTSGAISILEPVRSENVLKNLKVVHNMLSIDDYMDIFSQDFLFIPDPTDKNAYPEVFSQAQPWDRDREHEFIRRLFDRDITSYIAFDATYLLEETGAVDRYSYSYSMSIIHNKDAPKQVEGRAEVYLKQDERRNWSIFRWEDERTEEEKSTWGELRARF